MKIEEAYHKSGGGGGGYFFVRLSREKGSTKLGGWSGERLNFSNHNSTHRNQAPLQNLSTLQFNLRLDLEAELNFKQSIIVMRNTISIL